MHLQMRRSWAGLENTICECEHLLPTLRGQSKDHSSVDNTEKNSSGANLSKNYHLSGEWGNEAMTKSPSFTEFFAQII